MRWRYWITLIGCLLLFACQNDKPRVKTAAKAKDTELAHAKAEQAQAEAVNSDQLRLVAGFWGPMPTGVAVSRSGRIFVNFPRWGDPVKYTVAEVKNGQAVPYPNLEINKIDDANPDKCLVSVQSVVVDEKDRLWILDTGSINFQPHKPGGPKLICVDLKQDKIVKTIDFRKGDAVLQSTYLSDIR